MPWNFDESTPIYAQLVDVLRTRIAAGYYPPGGRLVSVRDLAAEAGVNPNTMQRALSQLEQLGLVYTQRTAGRFITEDEALIQQVRQSLAKDTLRQVLVQMKALGFPKEQVIALLKEMEEPEDE